MSEADDTENALRPVIEDRVALHDAQVTGERDAADGKQRRQALLEEPGPPGLLVGHQGQWNAELGPAGGGSEDRRLDDEVRLEPALQGGIHAHVPTELVQGLGQGGLDVARPGDDVVPGAGEEGRVQTARVDAEALAEGNLPRPAPAALGIEDHAVDVQGQQDSGGLWRRVLLTRRHWCQSFCALPRRALAAEAGELAEEPVAPSLPHRAAPERIVGLEVRNGAGDDLIEHEGGFLGSLQGHQLRGNGPLLVEDRPLIPSVSFQAGQSLGEQLQRHFVIAEVPMRLGQIDLRLEGLEAVGAEGAPGGVEHPHPQWELIAVAAEFAEGDGQIGGRLAGELAVRAVVPVGGLEDTLPEPTRRLVFAEPVEDDGEIEIGPAHPGLVVLGRAVLQGQRRRQHPFGLAELARVAQDPAQLQHGVERDGVRLPVQLLPRVEDQPGLLHLALLALVHCGPTLPAGMAPPVGGAIRQSGDHSSRRRRARCPRARPRSWASSRSRRTPACGWTIG